MGVVTVLLVLLCCSATQTVIGGNESPNPIKTVKTSAGIYDCIDIRKQPVLNHPLLKNHQIRIAPTSFPITETTSVGNNFLATTLTNVGCPQGTVPIRRDGARAKSESPIANVRPMNSNIPGQHLAIVRSKDPTQTYYGARAFISVDNPKVGPGQTSAAQVWAMAGPIEQQNAVEAGWIVSPEINGDSLTRLFVKSTTDGYKTSCYNTKCPSFVQIDPNHPVDAELGPISEPGGKQYTIKLELFRDNATLDWWLILNDAVKIGYFPGDVFTSLKGGATYVAWGGLVLGRPGEKSPPMGMGVYIIGFDTQYSGFFTQVATVDASHSYIGPTDDHFEILNDSPYCYLYAYIGKPETGYAFMYGGEGEDSCGI